MTLSLCWTSEIDTALEINFLVNMKKYSEYFMDISVTFTRQLTKEISRHCIIFNKISKWNVVIGVWGWGLRDSSGVHGVFSRPTSNLLEDSNFQHWEHVTRHHCTKFVTLSSANIHRLWNIVNAQEVFIERMVWGGRANGRGVRGHAHLLPETHQKSTPTCKMTHTQHQLNAGRRN